MQRRDFLKLATLGAAAAVPMPWIGGDALRFLQGTGTVRPNFVFILIDDLGWADVGCYGSRSTTRPISTAWLRRAMRFTDAYAACPVCSPTRASILTGKYPARLHLTDWIPGEGDRPSQPL